MISSYGLVSALSPCLIERRRAPKGSPPRFASFAGLHHDEGEDQADQGGQGQKEQVDGREFIVAL